MLCGNKTAMFVHTFACETFANLADVWLYCVPLFMVDFLAYTAREVIL